MSIRANATSSRHMSAAARTTPASTTAPFNIGEAAARSGVSAKMVRHYESLGLLPKVRRTDAGYRQYSADEVHTLRFIRRARDLGFGMSEIAELLKLWQNRRRASADVKRIALAHVADLDRRIAEMAAMKQTLARLAACCHGDERPGCPILDELGDDSAQRQRPDARRPAARSSA